MMMMVLKSGGGTAMLALSCRPSWRPMCFASNIDTENLRTQLSKLHSEAETTRDKANNARLRLLRLSEAAEKLRRQAAVNVQTGREDDARAMLFQKKKVMQALEKSKKRIEVLDELSTKLNEAISVKERQLIGNVALDLDVRDDAFSPVRIVPPTTEGAEDLGEGEEFVPKVGENPRENLLLAENQACILVKQEADDRRDPLGRGDGIKDDIISSFQGITTFENFLDHLDGQLTKIEAELVAVLRISTLVADSHEKTKNFKVQQIMELIESIGGIRDRISSIKLADVKIR